MPAFDIQPRRPSAPSARPAAPVRPATVRTSAPRRETRTRDAGKTAPRTPLKKQRKARRRRFLILILVGVLVLFSAALFLLWQPYLRIQTVDVDGPDAADVKTLVQGDLMGTQYLILPKNSIFFLPIPALRTHILATYPDMQAISIAPHGLTSLHLTATGRITAFWWCGSTPAEAGAPCYETDMDGFIFAPVPLEEAVASSSELLVYAPLSTPIQNASSSALGNSLKNPKQISGVLSFVKALRLLNADIRSVDMRSDEADLYTKGGTRITYVMGKEQQAANLAATAFPTLNLNNGSLLYVDLRFESKVFFKKTGAP